MIPMSEDFLIDLSPSCTKEQAVLRLLGWGTETINKKYIHMNTKLEVLTDMKEISPAAIDLHELLTDTYQEALQRYEDAVPKDPTEEEMEKILDEHGPRIEEAEAFVERARNYLMDITDELARPCGDLRIDQEATVKVGSTCITIRSLEAWAEKRWPKPEESSTSENEKSSDTTDDFLDAENKGNRSFLLTLGLAVRALAESKGGKYGTVEAPNITQISILLSDLADKLGNVKKPLHGQGEDHIRGKITKANKLLKLFID